jgi:hypothetical protein
VLRPSNEAQPHTETGQSEVTFVAQPSTSFSGIIEEGSAASNTTSFQTLGLPTTGSVSNNTEANDEGPFQLVQLNDVLVQQLFSEFQGIFPTLLF